MLVFASTEKRHTCVCWTSEPGTIVHYFSVIGVVVVTVVVAADDTLLISIDN